MYAAMTYTPISTDGVVDGGIDGVVETGNVVESREICRL